MARRTIALLYSFALGYCRGTLRGIARSAAGRGDWDLVPVAPERATDELPRLRPDGILAHLFDRQLARAVLRRRVPLLSTCGLLAVPGVPRVLADDHAVGRLAAQHLLGRGLRHIAFIGHRGLDAGRRRAAWLRQALAAHGLPLAEWWVPPTRQFDPHGTAPLLDRGVLGAIRRLPRPLGIACASDILARQLLELLHGAGVRVPDEVAVLGVDDDDLLCRLARPALSSVQLDAEGIGATAAGLLADWLERGRRPPEETLLPPRQVVARASTDRDTGVDPDLAAALTLDRPVAELAARLPVSRRTLERRARDRFGHGLAAERRRRRLAQAQHLLATTALAIGEVARRTGFASHPQLVRVFRREIGMTPLAWRQGAGGG